MVRGCGKDILAVNVGASYLFYDRIIMRRLYLIFILEMWIV